MKTLKRKLETLETQKLNCCNCGVSCPKTYWLRTEIHANGESNWILGANGKVAVHCDGCIETVNGEVA